jgi:crotonobetainyl-CoA:carnitine CoA-transferase CaiB-like acyl-CoA transferase
VTAAPAPVPAAAAERELLSKLRIIELANIVAGPSVGKHLADFGADVIKVEQPEAGDPSRTMGEMIGGRSAWWISLGRNKRSVTLNLKHPEGREALLRLVEGADALVESFRPGVLERLDLGPEALRERNEKLVVVRISGFGQSGPYSSRPGFGTLAEAYSGLAAISGYPDRPPLLAPTAIADEVAGLFATWSLLAALYSRDCDEGPPQTIDVSLFESLFSVLGPLPTLFRNHGYVQGRTGSRLAFSAPRNVYETRDGKFFVVSGTAPSAAETIVELVGGSALLADPRFATQDARTEHADELDAAVANWVAARTADEVEAAFEAAAVPGARVLEMPDIFADPHYRARGVLVDVPDEELGEVTLTAPVPRMDRASGRVRHAGPPLGRDTDAVLVELGYTDERIAALRTEGAW